MAIETKELTPIRIGLLILAIFFSWASVFLYQRRVTWHLPVNFCLWLFFLIPGMLHAFFLILFTEPDEGGSDLLQKGYEHH